MHASRDACHATDCNEGGSEAGGCTLASLRTRARRSMSQIRRSIAPDEAARVPVRRRMSHSRRSTPPDEASPVRVTLGSPNDSADRAEDNEDPRVTWNHEVEAISFRCCCIAARTV